MQLRTDHVAGAAFIAFGLIVYALSGDLPFGRLSSPGAGMMPKLATALMLVFGLLLIVRARESPPFDGVTWGLGHAVPIVLIAAVAIWAYQRAGFILTMALLLFTLLVGVERRNPFVAAAFSVGMTLATYLLFARVLKAPLEQGPFGF